MRQKFWTSLITYLSCCIDKELYKAIDYFKSQVEVLVEQQEKQNKRILLSNQQRMRVAAKAKRLSRKMLEKCMVLPTPVCIVYVLCCEHFRRETLCNAENLPYMTSYIQCIVSLV